MLVIVTGASRGIGLETVLETAKNPKIMVLAISRQPRPIQQQADKRKLHNILPLKADISTPEGIRQVLKTVRQLELPVSALVHNAGMLIKKNFETISAKDLHAIYQANVFSPFLLTQALLSFMAKGAHVVNISSMGGVQGSAKFAGLSAYSSSKGALAVLTECLAEELKSRQVAVNCLAIGAVQTEMLRAAFPGYRAPLTATQMGAFVADFALNGHRFFNGKILPVSSSTP